MQTVLEILLEELAAGRPATLVTPVETSGSLPTGRGARLLVRQDGSTVGTVGGGRLEAEARDGAMVALQEGKPRLIHFTLTAQDALEEGLLCGGEVTFWAEPVLPGGDLEVFRVLGGLYADRTPAVEAVRLEQEGPVQRLVARADGTWVGSLGSAALDRAVLGQVNEVIAEHRAQVETVEAEEGEQVQVFVQALLPPPTVYLFGGGHVGLALARIAPTAGFRVVVVDDRPEFANQGRFPMADQVYVRPFSRAVEGLAIDELAYVVVVTRGHQGDREVVAQALRTKAGYLGMIGSRRKIALTWEALRKEGFAEADLHRVHAPIGLDIGGETPGEIAVSILAEMIQVRRRGERRQR